LAQQLRQPILGNQPSKVATQKSNGGGTVVGGYGHFLSADLRAIYRYLLLKNFSSDATAPAGKDSCGVFNRH